MAQYKTEKHDRSVVLRFPSYVEGIRGKDEDDEAFLLVDTYDKTVIDLSSSVEVGSRWLKLFHRMALRARKAGKHVFLVGASDSIIQRVDFLALGAWETADTLREAILP